MWRAILAAFFLLTSVVQAETLTGKVANVAGDDTITILMGRVQVKVRVAGLDAPDGYKDWGDSNSKIVECVDHRMPAQTTFDQKHRGQ